MRRGVIVLATLGVLALGGVTVATAARRPKGSAAAGAPVTLPTGADASLPAVQVGVATAYAPSVLVDTGAVDYSYLGSGWEYAGIRKDW